MLEEWVQSMAECLPQGREEQKNADESKKKCIYEW
jgi:hypothetical protein